MSDNKTAYSEKDYPVHTNGPWEADATHCRTAIAARNILRQGLPNVKPVERGALAQDLFLSGTAFCEAGNLQKF